MSSTMDSDGLDVDLDLAWTEEYTDVLSDRSICQLAPMKSIRLHFLYIGLQNTLEHVERETLLLDTRDGGKTCIQEAQVLQLVQSKRERVCGDGRRLRYRLYDMATYFVTIDPKQLSDYASSVLNGGDFFETNSVFGSIEVPLSMPIFHSVNTIYFMFKEMTPMVKDVPRSILKVAGQSGVGGVGGGRKKTIKRVRICSDTTICDDVVDTGFSGARKTAKIRSEHA